MTEQKKGKKNNKKGNKDNDIKQETATNKQETVHATTDKTSINKVEVITEGKKKYNKKFNKHKQECVHVRLCCMFHCMIKPIKPL